MKAITRTAVLISSMFVPAAFAQTYIVPTGDCGAVTFNVGHFPKTAGSIAADEVVKARVYEPKKRLDVQPVAGAGGLTFDADVPDDAFVVMSSVDFKPVVAGNETRTDHAKVMIFCGPNTPVADWQRSSDLGFEVFPQGWNGPRPKMKVGDPMRFIAVVNGMKKLIGDIPMKLYRADGTLIADGVPAQYGGMNFPYQEPGRYVVVATYRRPDPQQAEHFLVDTSTLTFDIK